MSEWRLFVNPIQMGQDALWLVLPLCALVALVYKTVRVRYLRDLPAQVVGLLVYIVVGLVVLGVAMHLLLQYVA